MTMIDGRTGLEKLGHQACWELLERGGVGRVAVSIDGSPQIFPVNYLAFDNAVYFRSAPGAKVRALVNDRRVAFEIDEIDTARRTGWSVQVTGRAEVVTDLGLLRELNARALMPWAPGVKPLWVRLSPVAVTGRRLPQPRR
jgi:nitroimidazol reductase NimA-like FMN-containing flavoprotein (pyridoxamine 5'-phosphate oxidase superfamily)